MTRPWTFEEEGVNRYLDTVNSLLIALSQRRLNEAQRERLARLLQTSERGLLLDERRVVACSGPRCLTWIEAGRELCSFCARTPQ
jgi:hypothetical protein